MRWLAGICVALMMSGCTDDPDPLDPDAEIHRLGSCAPDWAQAKSPNAFQQCESPCEHPPAGWGERIEQDCAALTVESSGSGTDFVPCGAPSEMIVNGVRGCCGTASGSANVLRFAVCVRNF